MPHNLPPGVSRGNDGKFVSAGDLESRYDDLEYLTTSAYVEIAQADWSASTNNSNFDNRSDFEGVLLLDVDRIVDRHEVAHLEWLDARLMAVSPEELDTNANFYGTTEISASPSRQAVRLPEGNTDSVSFEQDSINGDITGIEIGVTDTDSADLPVRPLSVTGNAGVYDVTNGVGSGHHTTTDETFGPVPGTWDFDRRDEVYMNGIVAANGEGAPQFGFLMTADMIFGITEG